MGETPTTIKATVLPSVIARVKEFGFGSFPKGIYFLLREYDRLQGTVAKHDEQIASKGVRKSDFKEDPRLKRAPGEHQAKYNARLTAYINNLPETRKNKIRAQLEHYITRFYHLHDGSINEDTMFETQVFDAKGSHLVGAGEEVRIMEYITPEERDDWVVKGLAHYNASHQPKSAAKPAQPIRQTKQLTPEALLGLGFKRTPSDMTDEQIEGMNADWAEGGAYFGHPPLREMEK